MKPIAMFRCLVLTCALAALCPAAPSSVAAETAPGEIGILLGLGRADADLVGPGEDADTSPVVGLRGAARCNTPWSPFCEALYGHYATSLLSDDSKVLEGRAGVERIVRTSEPDLSWFLSGALGYADVNYPSGLGDFGRAFLSAGIGVRIDGGTSGRWRLELRGEQWLGDVGVAGADIANGHFLVGWSLPLRDREPGLDSDRDGVPDASDECARTPLGARVDARGCPLDSDGDGVYDGLDRCPGTPRGVAVDEHGCPKKEKPLFEEGKRKLILEGVNFITDSDELTPEARGILDRVAASLRDWPGVRVEIGGHTDWIASEAYNLDLSQRRANSVRRYLVEKGTEGSRLEARGYGEKDPIASNETAEGRAKNRRVELTRLD